MAAQRKRTPDFARPETAAPETGYAHNPSTPRRRIYAPRPDVKGYL